jgi:hypothetical protein
MEEGRYDAGNERLYGGRRVLCLKTRCLSNE